MHPMIRALLHRAMLTTSAAKSRKQQQQQQQPQPQQQQPPLPRLRFLLTAPAASCARLAELAARLSPRLPGCSLDWRAADEARACAGRYDAVFVVLDSGEQADGQTLPEALLASLRCEKWRFHLLASRPQLGLAGVAHWLVGDSGHLQEQLRDLMYERARDVQRICRLTASTAATRRLRF